MPRPQAYVTNLELRTSNLDGSESGGLQHKAEGMFLLHVLELAAYGEPKGSLTLVHDAGDHGARYEDFAHVLAEGGWAIALPDMRGHGRSEGERGHSSGASEWVRDIEAIQDHLAYRLPDAPKVLVGQGLGALQCLAYALEKPGTIQALVLLAPLFEARFQLPAAKTGLLKLFSKVGPLSPGSLGWKAADQTSDPAELAARAKDGLLHDTLTLHAGQAIAAAIAKYAPGLATLELPVLVVHGEADAIAPLAALRQYIGNKELVVWPGLKHDLVHEREAGPLQLRVRGWLESVLR